MAINNIREKLDDDQLDLSMMNLKEVPLKDIASVPRATTLDLSNNLLRNLPSNFGSQLTHLVKLDLSSNKLTSLPSTFHLLVNLKHLDLYNNQLKDLPPSLHHLKHLRFLDIKNNPLNPELQKIIGQCLTQKECESAAKKLIAHFTREKNLALSQEMANKAKEAHEQQQQQQQQKVESDALRQRTEKKTVKKDKQPEKKQTKTQVETNSSTRNTGSSGGSFTSKSSNNKNRRQAAGERSSGSSWCSFMGLINLMLMACIATAAGWCLHLHLEGDYSQAGWQAAVPRFQKSFQKLQNLTAEALQPENLKKTGQVMYKSASVSLGYAGDAVQKTAYAAQDYLEVYTGDLTPYTSQVSRVSRQAYEWTTVQCGAVYEWLLKQDWQGMWDATVTFCYAILNKLQEWWTELLKNPTVRSAWNALCEFTVSAIAYIRQLMHSLIGYLYNVGPVWAKIIRDNTMSAVTSVKDSVQSMLK